MQAILVGISSMKGKSKKTGKDYDGTMLHISYEDENVEGSAVASVYVDKKISLCDFDIGDVLEFVYETNFNGFTRLSAVNLVSVSA